MQPATPEKMDTSKLKPGTRVVSEDGLHGTLEGSAKLEKERGLVLLIQWDDGTFASWYSADWLVDPC